MDISVIELNDRLKAGEKPIMIDVREQHEWDMQHLDNVIKISLGDLPGAVAQLAEHKDKEVIMICRSGGRSGNATNYLRSQGFSNVRNMNGGMLAWKTYVDNTFNVM